MSTEEHDQRHRHGHHHGHHHGVTAVTDRRALGGALALIVAFMCAEVVVALTARSTVLLSDAGHMLTDAAALAMSLTALGLAARPARGALTYGWKRAEILSAAINGVTLLVVSGLVAFEAIRRLVHPARVDARAVLVVALAGVAVNLAAAWLLGLADRTSLNVAGAFWHVVTDLLGFVATAAAALVVLGTGYERADPIASLVVVLVMLRTAWGLLRDSGRILLEAAPAGVDLDEVREHLVENPHVRDVHDLHVWTLTSDVPALSAHVVVDEECFAHGDLPALLDTLQGCLGGHFDVAHSTFQFEASTHAAHEGDVHR